MKAMKVLMIIALVLALGAGSLALAQSSGLTLPWHAFSGGGGESAGGELTLTGALGPWAGQTSSGGPYSLRADWLGPRGSITGLTMFMPAVMGASDTREEQAPVSGDVDATDSYRRRPNDRR